MRPALSLTLIAALCAGCGDTSTSKSEPAAPTAQARDVGPAQGEVQLARPEYRTRATVLETRASRTRPDVGFVKFKFELVNATDQPVMTLIVSPMFGRRVADSARGRAAEGGA